MHLSLPDTVPEYISALQYYSYYISFLFNFSYQNILIPVFDHTLFPLSTALVRLTFHHDQHAFYGNSNIWCILAKDSETCFFNKWNVCIAQSTKGFILHPPVLPTKGELCSLFSVYALQENFIPVQANSYGCSFSSFYTNNSTWFVLFLTLHSQYDL